jgi:hypothetical protein
MQKVVVSPQFNWEQKVAVSPMELLMNILRSLSQEQKMQKRKKNIHVSKWRLCPHVRYKPFSILGTFQNHMQCFSIRPVRTLWHTYGPRSHTPPNRENVVVISILVNKSWSHYLSGSLIVYDHILLKRSFFACSLDRATNPKPIQFFRRM